MLRILVADDEPRHRRGLAKMINTLRPDYEIFSAKNGDEALQIVFSDEIDIIITDIIMPIIDGLELIEKIKFADKNIKVIILSGYAYFEYAQKAVSLGAFDYLLKPVDEEKIENMLLKVEKAIQDDKNREKEKELISKKLKEAMPILLTYKINKWVEGNLEIKEFPEIKQFLSTNGYGLVILTEVDHAQDFEEQSTYSDYEWNEILLNIQYWLDDATDRFGEVVSFNSQHNDRIIISILKVARDRIPSELVHSLDKVLTNIQKDYQVALTIGMGKLVDNIFDNVHDSFKCAQDALCYKFYLGTGKVITSGDIYPSQSWSDDTIYKYEDKLIKAIRTADKSLMISIIDELFRATSESGLCLYPKYFLDSIYHLLYNLIKAVYDLITQEEYNKLVSDIRDIVSLSKDCGQLKIMTSKIVCRIADLCNKCKEEKDDIIIKKCIEFIHSNYKSAVSMETVAETFYFNPSYFSTFFKKHVGCTFSQYLLKVRMNNALDLLKNTESKIYEISELVGFNDVKYFNRVFKKEYGMTPEEYRRTKFGGA